MRAALFILLSLFAGAQAFAPASSRPAFRNGNALQMAPRNDPPTAATGVKAVAFFGAAAASLGLILAAPFANIESPGAMSMPVKAPKEIVQKERSSKPKKEKAPKKEKTPKQEKKSGFLKSQGYDF